MRYFLWGLVVLALALPLGSAAPQSSPCSAQIASWHSRALHERLEKLLESEVEQLDHLQRILPKINCAYRDGRMAESCRTTVSHLGEVARDLKGQIGKYRSSADPSRSELFDIYYRAESLLKEIELLMSQDNVQGALNRAALAEAYNSFIKLTDVWFTGEVRNIIEGKLT
jgi:hypothetical protein